MPDLASAGVDAFKAAFFDRQKVQGAVDRAKLRVESKFGAFVRTRSRSSIRKRKKSAQPGSPPSDHGGALKRLIYFGRDSSAGTTIVGPAIFPAKEEGVPARLEYGGVATRRKHGKLKTAIYEGNPFMRPALAAERPKFAPLWKDAVTAAEAK